jgi:hypothetical protein
MVVPSTKLELEARLAKGHELLREFPDGPIPQMLHDMEGDLLQQLRDLGVPKY